MYLKRLELCGFKSFADKTRLDFDPGITAIIGPNGCGKSNISDAIKWCLGEQSSKSLRSHQMMDVLFGGSQSRSATGMSEVSMTFDNSQNILPIDYSEVTVTRRLFRSGESEYFINKVQCRLKDIKDLFLDTGIGAEGYSMMEQGKVEFILSAKPEERRELFEEAAGVSKYKARREETLRKLEKVEIDMNRVNDMLALLKEQISSLDSAARKARQYQKYQEDLKRLETASLVQQIIKAVQEIDRLKAEIDPLQQEYEMVNTAVDKADAEISEIRLLHMEKDELFIKLQDELSQTKSNINLSDERVRQAAQRETELTERLDTLKTEIHADTQRIDKLAKESQNLSELCRQLSEQVSKLETEHKNKEQYVQELRAKLSGIVKEESDIKGRLFNMATEKTNLHNEHNRLISLQTRFQGQILTLRKELTRLEEQFIPLNEQVNTRSNELSAFASQSEQISGTLQNTLSRISEIEQLRIKLQSEQDAAREKVISLESKIQMLREWEEKDPQRVSLRSALALDLPGLKGPVSSLIRIAAGAEDIVANALGEKLNYLICDSVQTAQKAIEYLQNNNLGRCTFIITERLPDNPHHQVVATPPAARALISLIQYDQQHETVMRFLCSDTLIDGYTMYGQAVIQGGSRIVMDKPMLFEAQVQQLKERIEEANAELAKNSEVIRQFVSELGALAEEKTKAETELQTIKLRSEILGQELANQKQDLQYMEKEIELNKNDIISYETEDMKTTEEIKKTLESIAALEKEDSDLKKRQQAMEHEVASLREQENASNTTATESKIAWATQDSELAARRREEVKLKETVASLEQAILQSRQEIQTTETKISEQRKVQENETRNLKEYAKKQAEQEEKIQVISEERQSLLKQIEHKNTLMHEQRAALEDIKHRMQDFKLEEHSFELQKQNTEQRLRSDFLVSFDEVREQFSVMQVQEEEIARLKRRIESMGPVNLAAPEEYANIEERYNFLLNQQQDLIKAKDDLHKVIQKINQNTVENFAKTFTQVRENFQNIYHQLFEGGEADLQLTDENNLLESGVEIFAQPPGKKLQNIALLSGGEKALTAIALLFSFYMVRPSPFCILDEVDAPLDEANIGRFVGMVKSFAFQSQFLIVTHNKRTMEMADVLYGVTMEELGVSKIISVRLSREELAATA
ncbi:MAG: chromosome segregation protein SMC [Elusimicrobiota bacterium]